MAGKTYEVSWFFSRQTLTAYLQQETRVTLRIMVRRGFRHLPVIDEARHVLGIASAQDIVEKIYEAGVQNFNKALDSQVREIMTPNPETLMWNDGLLEAIRKMDKRNIGALPIVSSALTLQGIVTLRDLIFFMGSNNEKMGLSVGDIMTVNPVTTSPETNVMDVMGLMSANKIRRVIVSKDERAIGMVSNMEILRFLEGTLSYGYLDPRKALKSSISKFIDPNLVIVEREDDARTAAYNMAIYGIGGLVVGKEKIEGVVTERDVIRKTHRIKGGDFMMRVINPREDLSERPNW